MLIIWQEIFKPGSLQKSALLILGADDKRYCVICS